VTLFNNLVRLDKVGPFLAAKKSVSPKEMKDSLVFRLPSGVLDEYDSVVRGLIGTVELRGEPLSVWPPSPFSSSMT
jgi:hypothetical protein